VFIAESENHENLHAHFGYPPRTIWLPRKSRSVGHATCLRESRFSFRPGQTVNERRFRDLCLSNGIVPPVGNTGICFDNAAAESFNATLKKELIHLHVWSGLKKVRQAVFGYIERCYNRKIIQKS
jgi:transposase InsO family protein